MDREEKYSADYVRAMEVLLQSAPGGIFSYAEGFDDQFSFISENMLSFLGYTAEEFDAKFHNRFSLMVYQDDRERVLKEIDDQIRIRPFDTCEYRIEKKDGSLVWVHDEGHLVSDENGKKWFYVVIVDISATLRKQEEERQKFHQTIQSMLSADPDAMGIIQVNLTTNTCEEAHVNSTLCANIANLKSYDDFISRIRALVNTEEEQIRFSKDFDRDLLLKSFAAGKDSRSSEYSRKDLAGEQHWIRTAIKMIENPISLDVEAVLYSTDVTQEKLLASLSQIMMKEEYDFIALLRPLEGKVQALHLSPECPETFRNYFGKEYTYVDFAGLRNNSVLTWVDPDFKPTYLAATEPAKILEELKTNDHYEILVPGHRKDGSVIYRKLQHYLLGDGTNSVLIFDSNVTRLILAQKKEAEAAKAAAEETRNLMDSIGAGIAVLFMSDPDHVNIRYVNRQMFKILCFPTYHNEVAFDERIKDPVVLHYIEDACAGVHPDDVAALRKCFHDNFFSLHFVLPDYQTMGGDGQYHWLHEEITFHENVKGGKVFYATFLDVGSEVKMRKEREARLEREKSLRLEAMAANEAKSDFLSRMSHDIRTPLNGIIGMTYLAKLEANPPKTQDCLDKIDTSSKFLLGLINDVLDMTKAEQNKMTLHLEPYSIKEYNAYIDAVVAPLIKEKGQHFVLKEEGTDCDLIPMADKLRTNQIFFNLLSNAVKYTPEGGNISYSIVSHYDKTQKKMHVVHTISDNGIGMSEDFQKMLFQPFCQEGRNDNSSTRGSGLGLSIVKHLVDLMGGKIEVESVQGKGSTFRVYLDFDAVKGEKICPKQTAENPMDFSVLIGKHVLLCEDHPLNQEIAKRLLENQGVIVQIAINGKAGVDAFSSSPIGYYDAILMDIRMPVMDGFEAAMEIRKSERADARSVPIIAMTADAFKEDVAKCFSCGMNAHLAKPIAPDDLYHALIANMNNK